jgi:hypothetical protein
MCARSLSVALASPERRRKALYVFLRVNNLGHRLHLTINTMPSTIPLFAAPAPAPAGLEEEEEDESKCYILCH